uniref:Uncharacterized protein n=1 Tax=Anguilla anguilla TaxID=7936 RepID=A0A0E9T799_ANGAN
MDMISFLVSVYRGSGICSNFPKTCAAHLSIHSGHDRQDVFFPGTAPLELPRRAPG